MRTRTAPSVMGLERSAKMSLVASITEIRIPPGIDIDEFILKISRANEGIRIEQTVSDRLTIMSPSGFDTSDRNSTITAQLRNWTQLDKRGRSVDSNTLFVLPDGRKLGPDTAWISRRQLEGLTDEDRKRFLRRTPEFVIELMSPSDSKDELRRKMETWVAGGVLLGWLIDPEARSVEIYRPERPVEVLSNPLAMCADGPVDGFVLDLAEIWPS